MCRSSCIKAIALSYFIIAVLLGQARADNCANGCITLCNNTEQKVTIATANPKGGLGCAFSGNGCRVAIEGWWNLEPGQCYQPNADLYWSTYYSVVKISPSGDWLYPSWEKDQALLDGDKSKGLSGYSGYSICVNKQKGFRREVSGKMIDAFTEACPAGYKKSLVNLYTSGQVDYDLTYSIK